MMQTARDTGVTLIPHPTQASHIPRNYLVGTLDLSKLEDFCRDPRLLTLHFNWNLANPRGDMKYNRQ